MFDRPKLVDYSTVQANEWPSLKVANDVISSCHSSWNANFYCAFLINVGFFGVLKHSTHVDADPFQPKETGP